MPRERSPWKSPSASTVSAPITVRRFFSGAGLVADGVQLAFVIGGSLYLKIDDEFRPAFEAMGAKPFVYEGKRKPVTISSYYETPEDVDLR